MNVTLCVVRSSSKNPHIHFPSSASASEIRWSFSLIRDNEI